MAKPRGFKPSTPKQVRERDLHENIAAISAELWSGNSKFYERHGSALSGFPGVWMFAVDAAHDFTAMEDRFAKEYGTKPRASFEYLDAILPFAEWLAACETLPTTSEMLAKAWELIRAASTVKSD